MYLIHYPAIICVATYPSITYIFVADIFQTQKSEIWKLKKLQQAINRHQMVV